MKLGKVQISVLWCLSERERGWIDHPYGPGWVWGSVSGTRKTLEALVKKGMVDKVDHLYDEDKHTCPKYLISQAGKVFLLGRPYGN